MSNTSEVERLVLSALVFEEYPKLRIDMNQKAKADLYERAVVSSKSGGEMAHNAANFYLQRASSHQVLPAANRGFQIGLKVLVWKEDLLLTGLGMS